MNFKHAISIAITMLTFAQGSEAAEDWQEELRSDVVKIVDGKYVYEQHYLMENVLDSTKRQLRVVATAPADGSISRDNFVQISTGIESLFSLAGVIVPVLDQAMKTRLRLGRVVDRLEAQGVVISDPNDPWEVIMSTIEITTLDKPIGKIDATLSIRMTKLGLQWEVKSVDFPLVRSTCTWKEYFFEE